MHKIVESLKIKESIDRIVDEETCLVRHVEKLKSEIDEREKDKLTKYNTQSQAIGLLVAFQRCSRRFRFSNDSAWWGGVIINPIKKKCSSE